MQLLYHILTFAILASALPSAGKQDPDGFKDIGKEGAPMTASQCNISQRYCYSEIVGDLSMFSASACICSSPPHYSLTTKTAQM